MNLDIKSKDIIYKIKTNNNKLITRNEKIIIFGNKERLKLLNNIPLEEFFFDITFKIIPDVYKPYKVMTLSAINYKDRIPLLVCLIFFSYMDSISYYNIFKYLNFELALNKSIDKIDFVKNKIIHIKCLFHFSNAIWNKIKDLGLKIKKYSKGNYIISNNINLLFFIVIKMMDSFKIIIIDNISKIDKHYDIFISYLKNYWLKKTIAIIIIHYILKIFMTKKIN